MINADDIALITDALIARTRATIWDQTPDGEFVGRRRALTHDEIRAVVTDLAYRTGYLARVEGIEQVSSERLRQALDLGRTMAEPGNRKAVADILAQARHEGTERLPVQRFRVGDVLKYGPAAGAWGWIVEHAADLGDRTTIFTVVRFDGTPKTLTFTENEPVHGWRSDGRGKGA